MTKQVPPTGTSKKGATASSLMWLAIYGLPLIAVAAFFALRPVHRLPQDHDKDEVSISVRDKMVEVGGVSRPMSDISSSASTNGNSASDSANNSMAPQHGTTPHLKPDLNPSTKAAFVSLTNQVNPEQTSPLIPAPPFDPEQFKQDPASYLALSVPSRVWQSGQPSPGVPVITSLVESSQRIRQGESVRLKVKAAPDMPVTFTSFDLGAFENQLTSITVVADAEGIAQASFTGTPGTIARVNILATSPMASGRSRFIINVAERE